MCPTADDGIWVSKLFSTPKSQIFDGPIKPHRGQSHEFGLSQTVPMLTAPPTLASIFIGQFRDSFALSIYGLCFRMAMFNGPCCVAQKSYQPVACPALIFAPRFGSRDCKLIPGAPEPHVAELVVF